MLIFQGMGAGAMLEPQDQIQKRLAASFLDHIDQTLKYAQNNPSYAINLDNVMPGADWQTKAAAFNSGLAQKGFSNLKANLFYLRTFRLRFLLAAVEVGDEPRRDLAGRRREGVCGARELLAA